MFKFFRMAAAVSLVCAFTLLSAGTGFASYEKDKNGVPLTVEQISQLDEVKEATSKYTDVEQAIADGYVPVGDCVDAELVGLPPEMGTMGIHYLNPSLLNLNPPDGLTFEDVLDPLKPELLLYSRNADGALELVGVEYMIAYEEWVKIHPELADVSREEMRDNAANYPRPEIFGFEFEGLMENHDAHLPKEQQQEPWHFDKHFWLFSDSDSGVDAQWNPNITCHPAGKELPNTATDSYNWLIIGSILVAVGSVFFVVQRRKSTV